MAQEADFYSADEAAKVLGIPVRQVFGMLCSGELEGYQDGWARWRVSASAVQVARRSLEPSDPGELPDESEPRPAEEETLVLEAEATTVRSDGGLLSEPSDGSGLPNGEETTQEAGETAVGGGSASSIRAESDDAETTESPPHDDHLGTMNPDAASNETVRELAERLARAAAKTRELRDRLELAEFTETALRESLERERERADAQNAQMERQRGATGQPEEEPTADRGEGIWRRFLGG